MSTTSTSAGSGSRPMVEHPQVLVTGASGFVGLRLVPWLRSRGWPVRAMVRKRQRAASLTATGADIVVGDLLDPSSLQAACAGVHTIIHLAAVADSSDEELNRSVNVGGSRNLGDAASGAGVRRIINFSSTCAGRTLRDAYGETKRLAEAELERDDVAVTHLRPAMIYGEGSKEWDLFVAVVRRLPAVPIPGTGRSILRPVFVEDLLDLVGRVLDRDVAAGRTYDVAGPAPVTTGDLVELVGQYQGLRRRVVPLPAGPIILGARVLGKLTERPFVNVDQVMAFLQDTVVDIEPARRDLGFDPRPLEEGLAEVFGGAS
ncbi:MAG: NAD(P)H-binding protein [Deltaproteobacteria bacterium]|nr:NAD(P)H-binding protein [Deltaproteobacteria bacterium]